MTSDLMEKIVALCKRRGFIYPGSEIYGGLGGTWDYGPLGVLLANNIKNEWWRSMVLLRENVVGLDSSILHHPKVWEASGHISSFTDPLVECRKCHQRYHVDQLSIKSSDYASVIKEFVNVSDKALDDTDISIKKVEAMLSMYDAILAGRNWDDVTPEEKTTLNGLLSLAKKEIEENKKRFNFRKFVLSELQSFKKFYGFFTWLILNRSVRCPNCGDMNWTSSKEFNLMFKTYIGPVDDEENKTYLRPETAQGIFINFLNVIETTRVRIPFGIAQIGKGFRNEITIGNFLFRVREFEIMELEFFVKPDEVEKWHKHWKKERLKWYLKLGMQEKNIKVVDLPKEGLAHYSKGTAEIWYNWPFMGFGELEGIANRGDYDLKKHSEYSGKKFEAADSVSTEGTETPMPPYTPYVIEPSVGVGRAMLAFLLDAYSEENGRTILKLHPKLAPYKVAVFPLLANKPDLVKKARDIYLDLKQDFMAAFDGRGNIGGRYASQDEIGTPFCITVDFQSLKDKDVTVRDRDTTKQERVKIIDLKSYLHGKIEE